MENVKNILVAIDLGESSRQALIKARELWDQFGATLHLVCVVQDPFALPWASAADESVVAALAAQMQRDAKAYLTGLLPPSDCERYHAKFVVCPGTRPSDELLAYAAANGVDLIVMGKGDHQNPEAATEVGSVTEAIMRRATCPVLVVPPQPCESEEGTRHDTVPVRAGLR
jgi:nucleotide-binding universal stress UspA family protein